MRSPTWYVSSWRLCLVVLCSCVLPCAFVACSKSECRGDLDCPSNAPRCVLTVCQQCVKDDDCFTGNQCLGYQCRPTGEHTTSPENAGRETPVGSENPAADETPTTSEPVSSEGRDASTGETTPDSTPTEPPPQEPTCTDKELCNGRDDNCDGTIDEGCDECDSNAACKDSQVCLQKKCVTPQCRTSADCSGGKVCRNYACAACSNNSECTAGTLCLAGACKKPECRTNADCSSGLACLSNQCKACTKDGDCAATEGCHPATRRCATTTATHQNGLRWADGKSARDCLSYRYPAGAYIPATKDGVYWIQPNTGDPAFRVYCLMSQEGGGWTLVLKADGRKQTFRYNNSIWDSRNTLNENSVDLDNNEAKLESYESVPFDEILIGLREPNLSLAQTKYARIAKKATSMFDLIRDKSYKSFDLPLGRLQWLELAPPTTTVLQPHCNREGFNLDYSGSVELRIGLISNEQNDCDTPDSFIGIGAHMRNSTLDVTVGYGAAGIGFPDRKDRAAPMMGYVFVRSRIAALNPLTQYSGARRFKSGLYAKSCRDYRMPSAYHGDTGDGAYWIKPSLSSKAFKVHCDMTTEGGGWTLALKADGRKQTFHYDAALWTNQATLNPTSVTLNRDEAKLESFSVLPFSQVLVQLWTPTTSTTPSSIILSKSAPSLYNLFVSKAYTPFDIEHGRATWKNLIPSSSLQRECNREGFNNISTAPSSGTYARVRIGILGNTQDNCDFPESRLGVGAGGSACRQDDDNTVGNATGSFTVDPICRSDNGAVNHRSFGAVFIR